MVPIETYMLTLWLIFAIVGISRRFPLELGSTIGFVGLLLFFRLGDGLLALVAEKSNSAFSLAEDLDLIQFGLRTAVIVAVMIMIYGGETFVYSGVWPPSQLSGMAIDVIIALFNGWLVVGSWWYFMDRYNYPQSQLGWFQGPISGVAARLLQLTPQNVIPEAHATWILGMALLGLLFLKIRR